MSLSRLRNLRCALGPGPIRPANPPHRTLLGIPELIGVLTNPGAVANQLAQARSELQRVKQEREDEKARRALPDVRTYHKAPGYFPRPLEQNRIRRSP